jgi:hypothetical protein
MHSNETIHLALDREINFLDTADMYGMQEIAAAETSCGLIKVGAQTTNSFGMAPLPECKCLDLAIRSRTIVFIEGSTPY